jgi:hypothetical protein
MDNAEQNIEEAFVRSFVVPDKRQRYIELLANPKRRRKILDHLNHQFDYDSKYENHVPHDDCQQVVNMLKNRGAAEYCHVIADGHELDGSDVTLEIALESLWLHSFAYIIICDPKHLAYFQAETPSRPVLLVKK